MGRMSWKGGREVDCLLGRPGFLGRPPWTQVLLGSVLQVFHAPSASVLVSSDLLAVL